ncbi:MAG TPA: carboxypeptidase-like regulatory domain-containing protein [Kofleriaceae bacterium]
MIGAHDVAKTWTFHLEDVVVKGRIVDARGVPVVGAKVRLQLGGVATSDHEGHYELAGLARARYWLTVEADGYAQTSESLDLERDVTTRDIEMNDGCTIDGMVVDDRDRPQANIAILVNLRGQKSDAGGRFHLEHERCRNVGVSVADDSGTFQMFNFVEGQLGKIRLVVPPRDRTIRGRVVDPSGLPAGDGTVYVGKEQSESVSARIPVNADGTFVVDHLADGLYEVTASRDDYPSATVAHVKTGSSVTVQFASGLTLHGVARDESGRPLPDFSVGFGAEKYKQNHFHNADGRFRIDALEPGTYTLHLAVGDEHGLAEVHLDERHQDFEVVLDTSVTVVGLVQTTDHRPAADVTVHVRHVWTKTDATGHFEVPRLSRGQLSIQLGGWDGQTVERDASNPGVIDLGMITLDPPK